MAYVAVKGGERAIDSAHAWLAEARRGNPDVPELALAQIEQQLGRAVDRAMGEGSLYDRELAALAVKQAQGDLIEAAFLLRAFRTTLPRFAASRPVDTACMEVQRRISAVFKDLPGARCSARRMTTRTGCWISRLAESSAPMVRLESARLTMSPRRMYTKSSGHEGLIEPDGSAEREPGDLTREPLSFPADRDVRLQALARGDEGFLLGLGYSTQRGYGGAPSFRRGDSAWGR